MFLKIFFKENFIYPKIIILINICAVEPR